MVFAVAHSKSLGSTNYSLTNRDAYIGPHAVSNCAPDACAIGKSNNSANGTTNTPPHNNDPNAVANAAAHLCSHGGTNCAPNCDTHSHANHISYGKANITAVGSSNCVPDVCTDWSTFGGTHKIAHGRPNLLSNSSTNNSDPHAISHRGTHAGSYGASNIVTLRSANRDPNSFANCGTNSASDCIAHIVSDHVLSASGNTWPAAIGSAWLQQRAWSRCGMLGTFGGCQLPRILQQLFGRTNSRAHVRAYDFSICSSNCGTQPCTNHKVSNGDANRNTVAQPDLPVFQRWDCRPAGLLCRCQHAQLFGFERCCNKLQ
jgi:hypothetical protein